jgi:uncharacterized membrane protein
LAAAAVRAISTLPRVSRAGVLAIAIGLLLDVTYHAGSHTTSLEVPCCGVGFVGHLLTLTGMILVLVGVVTTAFRHDRRPNEPEERR